MPALPVPGTLAAKRSVTGRLYFKERLSPGALAAEETDLGNVLKWKRTNKTETLEHMASRDGIRVVDDTMVHTLGWGYTFTLDEFGELALALIAKALGGTTVTQAAVAAASTVTINDVVQGFSYYIGKVNVVLENVKVGAALKTGYTFNPATGYITILPGGDIADLADIIVQYSAAAATFSRFTAGDTPQRRGVFRFYEQDQNSRVVRAIHTWEGNMWVNEDAEQTAEAYGTFELNCSCSTPPVVDERQN
ncbi:MAG: hypothetical protein J0L84_08500 [Verrucomicrobia bacterium]|nr:hypothetical protein [Verrucomicrobiota bacterium]